jgi:hypothetical protein
MATTAGGMIAELVQRVVNECRSKNQDTKGWNMHLYLINKMNELKVEPITFFRIAHVNIYGTDPDMHNLVAQYKLHGIIPQHVIMYLRRLQESE